MRRYIIRNKYPNGLVIILMLLISFTSCSDFVDIDYPDGQIVRDNVFNDDQTAETAVKGIYNELYRTGFTGGRNSISIKAGLAADNLQTIALDYDMQEFEENDINIENIDNLSLWSSFYNIIYMTNLAIEGIEASNELSKSVQQRLNGELKFIRAFCYFYMSQLYGSVPLILSTNYSVNANAENAEIEEINDQIRSDLEYAIDHLEADYLEGERYNVNRYVAMSLLARMSLFDEDWDQAVMMAGEVIDQNQYQLAEELNEVFLANSSEAIWQISPMGADYGQTHTRDGNFLILDSRPSGTNPVGLTSDILDIWSDKDHRFEAWIGSYEDEENIYYFPNKYQVKYDVGGEIVEYAMVMRLAEQYLIRAEAYIHQGNLLAAIEDIDQVRNRSGLDKLSSLYPNITQDALLDSLYLEKRKEFFSEWGIRWLDLKRNNKAEQILPELKEDWQNTDALFPIPQQEISKNPNLVQNEGY